MTWFRLLYVYQSGVKKHPSDILQGLICQTYSDIGPDYDFPNGVLFGTYSEKIRYGQSLLYGSLEGASSITNTFACHKLKVQYCYFLTN